MKKIKKGDVVGRISYGKDIFFVVDRIIELKNNNQIAILKGLTVRIKADSPVADLEIINSRVIKECLKDTDEAIMRRIRRIRNTRRNYKCGRILHLDGDSRYSQKSARYYKNLGIDAAVKNISEGRQPVVVASLLARYKPDVLVITGHDGMIKSGTAYNDIYNYRNSAYFMKAVIAAKNWEMYAGKKLAIFARCLSKLL